MATTSSYDPNTNELIVRRNDFFNTTMTFRIDSVSYERLEKISRVSDSRIRRLNL